MAYNSCKSSSTGQFDQFDWPMDGLLRLLVRLGRCWSWKMTYIQWVNIMPWLVHSPIPDRNLISSSRISHLHQHHLMALDGAPMKSLLPGHTCQTLFSWFRDRTSPTNCDDPVHGSGPGEIVFRHMSVVQRGVRSRELPPPQPLCLIKNCKKIKFRP